jgi:hypothetical protein
MGERVLFANGCSMTYGSELADEEGRRCVDHATRERLAWPNPLRMRLGYDHAVNHGVPSGSNDRIVRTTIGWVLEHWVRAGRPPEDLLVVIGWSGSMRREFYIDEQWHQVVPYHDHENEKLHRLNLVYREVAWHERESALRFLTQIVSLQSFLRLYKIPYLFFDAISPVQEDILHAGEEGKLYEEAIVAPRYFGFDEMNRCMADVTAEAFPSCTRRHPSAEGHAYWAGLLAESIARHGLLDANSAPMLAVTGTCQEPRQREPTRYVYP